MPTRKCNKCQQNPSNGKFYTVTNTTGSYCNNCADELCKPLNNSSPNTKNVQYDAKCQECGIEIGVGTHCSSCFEKETDSKPSSNDGKGKQTWGCGNCQKDFTDQNDLDNHMRDAHGLGREKENNSLKPILIGSLALLGMIVLAMVIKKSRRKKKGNK